MTTTNRRCDAIEAERDMYRLMYDQFVDFVDERGLGEDYVLWLEERLEK